MQTMMTVRRKLRALAGTALFLMGSLLASGTSALAAEGTWHIESRSVPPPAAASESLRAAVAAAPVPDVAARRAGAPADADGWREVIAARDRARTQPLDSLAENFAVTIERASAGGVAIHRMAPRSPNPAHASRVFLYLHGGAYVYGAGDAGVYEAALIAGRLGIPVVSVDYRMPPEHPFPAALDDTLAVYRHLLESYAPGAIAVGGTSAGGGLALAAVHRARADGLAVPGAIYAGTPWADLTKTGDTLYTNEGLDRALVSYDGSLAAAARLYAGAAPLDDPLLSPVNGDFAGFPPTYLVTGTRDLFLSDTVRVHRKLRRAGVVADLVVFEGLSHAEYLQDLNAPESIDTYAELGAFLEARLR
jgi:epsilon-lactone hydrolase